MKYSTADPSVRPNKQLGLIVPWTVFNLLACAAFAALFVGLVCGPVARRTPVLVSLYAVFVLATAAGPMLSWTGRVMTPEVPVPLCVVSAAFGSSWSLTQVSAAFALVLNVWTHTLRAHYPRSTVLQCLSSSILHALIPWVAGLPFFFAALVMGTMHNEMVTRASPLYCTFNLDLLNSTLVIIGAAFEIGAVLLALWTGAIVVRARWRTRTLRSENSGGSAADAYMLSLTIRTLLFIAVLTLLFIAEITTTISSFSNPTTDIISAVCDVVAAGIFAADRRTLRAVRKRVPWLARRPQTGQGRASVSITLTQQTHVHRSPAGTRTEDWKDELEGGLITPGTKVDLEAASPTEVDSIRYQAELQ